MKHFLYCSVLISCGIFGGCKDAPRDNPLDPQSPQYISTATITGTVAILNQNTPLPFATILSMENGSATTSDASGTFSFENLTVGTQTLICTKENYTPDTQQIVLQTRAIKHVNFSLNGAPYILSQNIYTRKIDRYYPSVEYYVDITASVTDPNGVTDIDSVWFSVDTILFPMTYSVSTRLFQTVIYNHDLPTNTTQWLVNRPLRIRSKDIHQAVNLSTPFYVSRIIENIAIPEYPKVNSTTSIPDTTGPTPLLHWLPPDVNFNYTDSLTISQVIAGVPSVVWSYGQINSDSTEFQFPGNNSGKRLDQGNYVWTISVVDDFGNYSCSKEAAFVVK
jgi:hypothetical protein